MAPEEGDTRFLSRDQVELVADTREVKTRIEGVEKSLTEQRTRIEEAVEKASKASGYLEASVPDLQKRLGDAFEALGELEETANVYFSQIREMAKDIEKLTLKVDKKANQEVVDGKADKGETLAGMKNAYLWIKTGFAGLIFLVLLWVLTVLADKYGIPKP